MPRSRTASSTASSRAESRGAQARATAEPVDYVNAHRVRAAPLRTAPRCMPLPRHSATLGIDSHTNNTMSIYIDNNDRLHDEQAASLALTCPHCGVFAHITPMAVPRFAELSVSRPKQIGLIYRCDACYSPIFMRGHARAYAPDRIELSSQLVEVERPAERFEFTDLPTEIETLFRETLQCYSHGIFNAFATMCRRTMQAVFAHLGESGKLRVFDELNNVRDIAELDAGLFTPIKRVLFGTDADAAPSMPPIDEDQAALLLEVTKDLLYQCYVRRARLQQAIVVRRVLGDTTTGLRAGLQPAGSHAGD
jgi:hypothetical protein